ncbi:hypothetical protein Ddye_025807 [Dipteronia dyeriana]|uniref:RNase H type-1 domain-containing protein n=1 Tax=Dipteronia dyeriana TaxID=168575 RepID=A0AAD9WPT2_9ROSI|nr:hypothetical protein Ddye_025807 [Dipteronia dyeriana]
MFSPNVTTTIRKDIQSLFRIDNCNSQDRYLGFPSMVGRNKRILFGDIKERVWKKMRDCKDSYSSFGEIKVLIKAIVQAIPTNSMNIFKLPVSLCKELIATASKFWWGSKVWNNEKLNCRFLPVDRIVIQSILISWSGDKDFIMWHFDRSGEFTVRSGYRLAVVKRFQEDRNSLLNCDKVKLSKVLISWAKDLRDEFSSSRTVFSPQVPQSAIKDSIDWLAPPPGLLKLNSGLALRSGLGSVGIGTIIRDDKGKVLVARSKLYQGSFSVEIRRFLALRDGLMLAKFYNLSVKLASSPVTLLRDSSFVVNDIKALL